MNVSKATMIAIISEFAQFTTSTPPDGFNAIITELIKHSVALILIEASGCLEGAIACSVQL